jgi:hypothetical protein
VTLYACSRCDVTAPVANTTAGVPMHPCAGLSGMNVPLAPADRKSKVELFEREDYVGGELVQRDAEGRVWMSARVTTDETEHVVAYAPTAHVTAS